MDLKVRFAKTVTVRDVIQKYETDADLANHISQKLDWWNVKDDKGVDVQLPERGSSDWYLDLEFNIWRELASRWMEWKFKDLPKVSAATSSDT